MNTFKKIYKQYFVLLLVIILVSCGKKTINNSDFYNEIATLKETRNISYKILDAYKINNDNLSFMDKLPNRLNVKYALKCNVNGDLIYNFYTDTYSDVGFLEEKNIDIYMKSIDNPNLNAKLLVILICDQAFKTKLFNVYEEELSNSDLVMLTAISRYERLLLSNIIKQLRGERDFKYQLSSEELDRINNN